MHTARIVGLGIALAALGPRAAVAQESAVPAAKAAAAASPSDAAASLEYGRALRRAGRWDEALRELRRGVAAARAADALASLHWEISRAFVGKRDFGQAMVSCKVVGAQTAAAARGHACAAEAHLLWRRGTEALGETAQALAADARLYEAKVAEARAHALALEDAKAEAAFKEAIGWKPEAPLAHLHYGRFLIDGGKTDAGVSELKLAQQKDASDPEIAYELGRALPPAEAAPQLERAVKERAGYFAALAKQAEVLVALGRTAEARAAAEAAAKTGVTDIVIPLALGRVALAEGKPDDALAQAKAALAILANSAPAKLLTADAYATKKEIDLAVEAYQAAYGFDHADPSALVRASQACLVNGRVTSAKAFGEKATKEFPQWGPGWVALGDALAADKEPARAKAAYETALKSKGPVDAAAVRAKLAALK